MQSSYLIFPFFVLQDKGTKIPSFQFHAPLTDYLGNGDGVGREREERRKDNEEVRLGEWVIIDRVGSTGGGGDF